MHTITTVAGPIAPESLGFCHCHEHLAITRGRSAAVNPALCIDDPELTLRELVGFRRAGGDAVVDAQPVGCGREAATLAWLSRQAGVHIIASTGFHKMEFYPDDHWIFSRDEDSLARLFVQELTSGMYVDGDAGVPSRQSPYRAGIIKCALDASGLTAQYAKCFAAAAEASRITGAPVMVHIDIGSDPLALADFWEGMVGRPVNVALCHLDRTHDNAAVHRRVAERGFYLEYDTIGRFKYHSDEREVELIAEMLASGFAEQILLGLDVTRERLLSYGGTIGLAYILNEFLPLLTADGLTGHDISRITRDNPSRFLTTRARAATPPAFPVK